MQSQSVTQLSWPQFTHQYKFIKHLHSQSSIYSPSSLYLNIKTKLKYFVKQITFQNTQQLQIIIQQIQKTQQSYKINERQYLCQMTAFCIKTQTKQHNRINNSRQSLIFNNKEGKILLIFQHFKTLQQIIESFLLSPNQHTFIQADSDIVTLKNFPYFSSIIPQKTLINILKTLILTVLFVKQFNLNFIKSFTLEMIELQNFGQVEQKCKVLFYPFAQKDIAEMVWNEEFLIEDSYVGQKVLQTINRFQANQFTQINLQNSQSYNFSINKKNHQKDYPLQVLSQQDINQSLLQSIGLLILKMASLTLGKQTFFETKFYKMNQKYQLTLNFQTIHFLLLQIKRISIYSKTLIDKIQKLIFHCQNFQFIIEMMKNQWLTQIQKQKIQSPFKQRKTFSIGNVSSKQKKQINTNLNLTPSKKIGIQMNKLVNRSGFQLNETLKQKKLSLNPRSKSKSNSNSRSNSIMHDKSKPLKSLPKPRQFSPSFVQNNINSESKKSLSPHGGSNRNANISINSVNSGIGISSERQNFIQTLKQKILYDPNTGLIHDNIISKQFRDGSTYLGQYNPARNIKEGYGLYFYFDGDIYGGTWKNDQLNGLGIYYFANGDSYEGGVVNGQKDGYGVYRYGNGNVYKGEWKKDKKQGKGQFSYANGDSYVGEFVEGRKQGHGVYKWSNGDIYEGDFARNMKNGRGKFKKANTQNIIEGQWENDFFIDDQEAKIFYGESGKFFQGKVLQNGIIDGNGMYQFQKNSFYEGQIKNNRCQGECTIHFDNGDIFKGQIKNDLFQGHGEYFFAHKNMKYIGSWLKGKQHGNGQIIYLNQGTIIETKWQNGVYGLHKAIIMYKDGSRYEGDINQNGRHGRGKYLYKDGKWIEGQFDCNKLVHLYEISQ